MNHFEITVLDLRPGHYKVIRSDGNVFFVTKSGSNWNIERLEPARNRCRKIAHRTTLKDAKWAICHATHRPFAS